VSDTFKTYPIIVIVVLAPGSRDVNQVDRRYDFFAIATAHHSLFEGYGKNLGSFGAFIAIGATT